MSFIVSSTCNVNSPTFLLFVLNRWTVKQTTCRLHLFPIPNHLPPCHLLHPNFIHFTPQEARLHHMECLLQKANTANIKHHPPIFCSFSIWADITWYGIFLWSVSHFVPLQNLAQPPDGGEGVGESSADAVAKHRRVVRTLAAPRAEQRAGMVLWGTSSSSARPSTSSNRLLCLPLRASTCSLILLAQGIGETKQWK